MFSFDQIYLAMSADGVPQIDQTFVLLHALGTAFLDVCVFLACLNQDGHRIRSLGLGTDAPGHLANLSSCITGAAELQLISLMLATVSEEWGLGRPYCASVLHISMAVLSEDPVLSRLNERTSRVSERNKNTTRHKADG